MARGPGGIASRAGGFAGLSDRWGRVNIVIVGLVPGRLGKNLHWSVTACSNASSG
jgi:hypothetical protein